MVSIPDRVVDRELSAERGGERERLIGRRLKDGYVHYRRYLEILNALSRYGFGYIFDRIKSANVIPKLEGTKDELMGHSEARRLKLMFESLGPTFIKIGQMLSTRPDLVPIEYVRELEKLKDAVEPMEIGEVHSIISEELGKNPRELFGSFDDRAIGSASIGVVHRAVTKDGSTVAVKVQRRGVKDKIMVDMEILDDLSELFGDLTGISELVDPQKMVAELKRLLTRELDYTIEARSIAHFHKDFEGVNDVIIPGVYWELTTRRVLTMDFVTGIAVDKAAALKAKGIDTTKVAAAVGTAVAHMIFVSGYFHGDPHGGNILVQDNGSIALIDFGSVGFIDARMRDSIRLFYFSILREDAARAAEILLEICQVSESAVNRAALEQDIRELLDYRQLLRNGETVTEGMNQTLISVAIKHNFVPPPTFMLLERALMLAEGVCNTLSPNFDFNRMLTPILNDIIREKINTAADPLSAAKTASEYAEMMRKGPRKVSSVLEKLDAGKLVIKVESDALNELRTDIWRIFVFMTLSLFAMTLLILTSILGFRFKTPILEIGITAVPILVIWLLGAWWIMRRWRGPR